MLRNDHLFVTIDIYFCFTRTTEHYTYFSSCHVESSKAWAWEIGRGCGGRFKEAVDVVPALQQLAIHTDDTTQQVVKVKEPFTVGFHL